MYALKHRINTCVMALIATWCTICLNHTAHGQEANSSLKDRDGNMYTVKIMLDNKQWMTDNLNTNIAGSYCYRDSALNCRQYGRLYTWEKAKTGCTLLGDGWRLPADEEWQQMTSRYGGVYGDSGDSGKTAYQSLTSGGTAQFNALLGGGRGSERDGYGRLQAHGFYWASTESDTGTAWFYNFGKGGGRLYRQKDGEKYRAFSVRCVRDTGNVKE